jgi:hypothetical protein
MAEIPTADEFLNKEYYHIVLDSKDTWVNVGDIESTMVEFARIHVEAALKAASEKAKASLGKDWIRKEETIHPGQLVDTIIIKVDKDSILNSYPLSNIK